MWHAKISRREDRGTRWDTTRIPTNPAVFRYCEGAVEGRVWSVRSAARRFSPLRTRSRRRNVARAPSASPFDSRYCGVSGICRLMAASTTGMALAQSARWRHWQSSAEVGPARKKLPPRTYTCAAMPELG